MKTKRSAPPASSTWSRQLLQGKRAILIDLGKDSRHNKRLKPFSLPAPRLTVSNGMSEKFTVIEVMGLDRTGLLHQLTRQISDLNLTIGSAHIGTYGEKGRRRLLCHRPDRPEDRQSKPFARRRSTTN